VPKETDRPIDPEQFIFVLIDSRVSYQLARGPTYVRMNGYPQDRTEGNLN
jgi:hypothetical protein